MHFVGTMYCLQKDRKTKKEMIYFYEYQSPIGTLTVAEEGGKITRLTTDTFSSSAQQCRKLTPVIEALLTQLDEYFSGTRKRFSVPINPIGTAFQKKVWQALMEIPYGKTCSYKDIAVKIGKPKACRAVGGANNKNPIMILIPCHRVIGKNGTLTGYYGGIDKKEFLLKSEQNQYINVQQKMHIPT